MSGSTVPVMNLENFMLFIAERLDQDFSPDAFEISEDFSLKFELKGEQWQDACRDGFIDYRAANIITSIQRDLFTYCSEATGRTLDLRSSYEDIKDIIVKVKVTEGSLNVEWLKETLKEITSKLNSWQATGVLISSVALGFGCYSVSSYNNRLTEIQKITSNENIIKALSETAAIAIRSTESSQETLKTVIKYMKQDDTFSNKRAHMDEISKQELSEYVIKKDLPEAIERSVKMDARFKVHALKFGKSSVQIECGPFKRTALTKLLSDQNKQKLLDGAKEPLIADELPEYDLQTSVVFRENSISEVYIIDIGEPRSDALTPTDVMRDIRSRAERKEQLLLFPDSDLK